jgi:hypothetical protein
MMASKRFFSKIEQCRLVAADELRLAANQPPSSNAQAALSLCITP